MYMLSKQPKTQSQHKNRQDRNRKTKSKDLLAFFRYE